MTQDREYAALSRDEVSRVVEGRGRAPRVPILLHQWVYPEAFRDPAIRARVIRLFERYPQDAVVIPWKNIEVYRAPDDDPNYRWMPEGAPLADGHAAVDARAPLADWDQLGGVLEAFPSADYPGLFPRIPADDGRYRIAHWWFTLFERHWSLRGMTNALTDYYVHPNEVHRLFGALTDLYVDIIGRARRDANADAVYVTDDLGTQRGPFFSPEVFDVFYAPYYRRLIDAAHARGMHFWLHTCGDIGPFLTRFIDLGLDVIHPIQKYCMDEREVVRTFGGQIAFWVGFDVQWTIPFGTPEDVRREVRHLFDTFQRPDGRFLFTAGNGITEDTPIESLEALFGEAYVYGTTVTPGPTR